MVIFGGVLGLVIGLWKGERKWTFALIGALVGLLLAMAATYMFAFAMKKGVEKKAENLTKLEADEIARQICEKESDKPVLGTKMLKRPSKEDLEEAQWMRNFLIKAGYKYDEVACTAEKVE